MRITYELDPSLMLSILFILSQKHVALLTSRGKVTWRITWSVFKSKTTTFGGQTGMKSSIDVITPASTIHSRSHLSSLVRYTEINLVQLISPLPAPCQSHEGYAWSFGLLPNGTFLGKKLRVAGTPERNLGVLTKILFQVISIPVITIFSGWYWKSFGSANSSNDHCATVSSVPALILTYNSDRIVTKIVCLKKIKKPKHT